MGTSEVEAFLTCLALDWNVAAATQNQGFSWAGFYTCPKQQRLSKLPYLRPFPALRAIFLPYYPPFYQSSTSVTQASSASRARMARGWIFR
jgi:hypothetical protein